MDTADSGGLSASEVVLDDFPEAFQDYDFDCGPAAAQAVLRYFKRGVELDELTTALHADPERGTLPDAICDELTRRGLRVIPNRMTVADLRAATDQGSPVILVLQAAWSADGPASWDDGHYVVAIGYRDTCILFEDPEQDELVWLTDTELVARWHDRDYLGNEYVCFGIVVSEDDSAQDDDDA